MLVTVALATSVLSVKVITTRGVTLLVGVRVGVRVAVKVGVGTSEAVAVGAVEVGKGPKSAWEVSSMAVLVPLAFLPASVVSGGILDMNR